ncbi:hypothetical protein ACTOB_006768 [Actinoplanes oblitus]|uniref:Uncharacterized protein n=1 Tax=Actinoplanes oblitus TaxID=3040509 RepID=A0ABY8WCR7_9ACTN|nr:hypothetical protein [Actinoplanes oblitus]WIM94722.1 hypothetical protein ACTOB_006768 [Actinoplanes oblitus]
MAGPAGGGDTGPPRPNRPKWRLDSEMGRLGADGTEVSQTPWWPTEQGLTERLPTPETRHQRRLAITALLVSLLALAGSAATGLLLHRLAAKPMEMPETSATAARATVGPLVTYAKEALNVRIGCAALVYLDLDEPRVGVAEQGADLRYDSRCGNGPARLTLAIGSVAGSSVANGSLDAAGCLRAIRTGPLGPGVEVEVRKGAALCVLTAAEPARLVLVEISEVGGTGAASLRATSWLAPT